VGSTAVGQHISRSAGVKKLLLELGGNGPVVVMDDADLELAAEAAVTACFLCAGQSCTAGERLLVHRAVREEYVGLLREKAQRVVLGDPFADGTTMGPLNNEGVAEKMDEHVADALERGAAIVHGGERAGGFPTKLFWQATVLDGVPADSRVATEETFGPVAPVVEITSLDQAIALANASPYGLLSAIFTRDLAAGLRYADEVKTRWVNIHDSSNYWEAHLPFGGRSGTASGIGRVGGTAPMESFTELQTVVLGV
jgi:succinate-semialdehyde dehydrogenase/glutarate-semialdehyde dehydrogenase